MVAVTKDDAATFLTDSLSFPEQMLTAIPESERVLVEYADGSAATWMRTAVAYGDGSESNPYFANESIIVGPSDPTNLNAWVIAGWYAGDAGTPGPYVRLVGILSFDGSGTPTFGLLQLHEIPGITAPE